MSTLLHLQRHDYLMMVTDGSLTEAGGGYTFFWKGLPQTERRIHGVGFAVRSFERISHWYLSQTHEIETDCLWPATTTQAFSAVMLPPWLALRNPRICFMIAWMNNWNLSLPVTRLYFWVISMHVWAGRVWPGRKSWDLTGVDSLMRTATVKEVIIVKPGLIWLILNLQLSIFQHKILRIYWIEEIRIRFFSTCT